MTHEARVKALTEAVEAALKVTALNQGVPEVVAHAGVICELAEQPVDAFAVLQARLGLDDDAAKVALVSMAWHLEYAGVTEKEGGQA